MSSDQRGSFIFYRSFSDAISDLCDGDKLIIYDAITLYALDRIEPQLSGFVLTIFKLIKPQLDANWKRFESGCQGRKFGHLGGAPKGNSNAQKEKTTPNQPHNNGKTTPNVNDNVNDNEESNRRTAKRFTPPSFDEVSEYILEMGYTLNATQFVDHYTANGWMVGRNNKMKDWRAALRNWSRREFAQPQSHSVTNEPQRRIYNDI